MQQAAHHRLEQLLDREIAAARGLTALLAAERAALVGDAPEAVQEKAAEKTRLLGSIEAMEIERRSLWGSAGTSPPYFPATVAERWRALLELMAGCRSANEVNGHIIHVRQGQIRQLIDIVRGGPAVTYGPRGRTFAKALRALARA